jgi:nitrate/nitrite transporter NarK
MMQMGAAASLPFFVGALGRVVGGWLSDNLFRNNRRALSVSFQVFSGALLLLTYISTSAWSLVILQTLSGFFLVGYQATFWALPINSIPKSRMGLATSFINMGGTIGGLVSPLCVGGLLEYSKGSFGPVGIFMEVAMAISCAIMFSLPSKTAKSGAELSFDS